MKKPKLLFNLLYGALGMILFFFIALVSFNFLPVIVSLLWLAAGMGAFVGLQIHILRRFSWLEYLENCKGEEE